MAAIDERLIDPTPDAIVALLHRATRTANGRMSQRCIDKDRDFWVRFVKRALNKPQGSQTYAGTRYLTWGSALVRAAWWTDPVGRRHWRVVGRRVEHPDYRMREVPLSAFPLWHVYPDRLLLRHSGKTPQLVARCDCGVAGPIDRIAWMGERCGPCHDRAEEGVAVQPAEPLLLTGKNLCMNQLTFAGPDVVVSAGCGRVIRWNLLDGCNETLLHRKSGNVHSLAAAPSGLVAANTAPNRVLIRRPGSSDWQQINLRCGHVVGLAISPDERWLAVASTNAFVIDLTSLELTARSVLPERHVGAMAFSPDSRSLWTLDASTELCRIDLAAGRADLVRSRPDSAPHHLDDFFDRWAYHPWPRVMTCSRDGRWLAMVASWEGRLGTQLGDLATGRWFGLRMPEVHVCSQGLAFTADGSLVSADTDGAVRLWDVARQQLRETLVLTPSGHGYQVPTFSPDGEQVALALSDGSIRLLPWRAMLQG